jgi:iron-sulfur cluster assembly accessory protein
MSITKEMTIEEIFKTFPQKSQKLAQAMTERGLHCVGCSASTWETIEEGMLGHGMDEKAVFELVDRLNTILQEKEDLSAITVTRKAAAKLREILEEEGKETWGVRFSEKAAGCSGFQHILDFSERPGPDDLVFSSSGIELHIHKGAKDRLLGSVIDYVEGLHDSGFKITNPNVKSACGCGSSHGY